ncbi:hypothetical protein ES708_32563 [subsurface metagenome]
MEIMNKTALKEAIELLDKDIMASTHLIASPAPPGLKVYNKERLNTLENIRLWLNIHN